MGDMPLRNFEPAFANRAIKKRGGSFRGKGEVPDETEPSDHKWVGPGYKSHNSGSRLKPSRHTLHRQKGSAKWASSIQKSGRVRKPVIN